MKRFLRGVTSTLTGKRVLKPTGTGRAYWDLIITIFTLYDSIIIPFRAVFMPDYHAAWFTVDYLIWLCYIIDIYLHFVTSYTLVGIEVTNLSQIRWHYLKRWFVLDVIGVFPLFELIALRPGMGIRWVPVFRLNRLLRLTRLYEYIRKWEKDIRINTSIVRMVTMGLTVILLAHWFGCIWYLIAYIENFGSHSWAANQHLKHASLLTQYIRCFYWAVATMTTVGYGDIVPRTDVEIIFAVLVMLIGASTYGYVMGSMASLISNLDANAAAFRSKMESVSRYMKYRRLPVTLQSKVRGYYEYLWTRHMGLDEGVLLQELPPSLRIEVALFLNRDIIKKVPLFEGCEASFVSSLVMKLKPQLYAPGDYIVRKGQVGREMYFISRGQVEVVSEDGLTVYATLEDGKFFGEVALLHDTRRNASVRAATYCDIFMLKKDDFEKVLEGNREFHEKIVKISQERYKTQMPSQSASTNNAPAKEESHASSRTRRASASVQPITTAAAAASGSQPIGTPLRVPSIAKLIQSNTAPSSPGGAAPPTVQHGSGTPTSSAASTPYGSRGSVSSGASSAGPSVQ